MMRNTTKKERNNIGDKERRIRVCNEMREQRKDGRVKIDHSNKESKTRKKGKKEKRERKKEREDTDKIKR